MHVLCIALWVYDQGIACRVCKIVRTLDAGMMLYPTGNKDGMMWEVDDELGNKGWVSSSLFELAR